MAFNQKDNSGALFPNDRKEKDTHPDWTGTAKIVCQHCQQPNEVYLNAWAKEKDGKEYFSMSIKPKAANDAGAETAPTKPASNVKSIKRPARDPR